MKNSIKFILIFTLVFVSLSFSVYAYENITVDSNTMNIVVDGERVFADNFVYSNTTYVPLRRVAEMLGKKVEWDANLYGALISDTDSPEITTDIDEDFYVEKSKEIKVQKNTMKIFVNGNQVDADNFVYKDTTYVPLRKISEMLSKNVEWEKLSNTAYIGKKGLSFFDGKVLGTINGIEYTDYMYDYYASYYDSEYEYYESMGENAKEIVGSSKEEYVYSKLKYDFALIDYALNNSMSMTPYNNGRYYTSVSSTLKGIKGDMEKFRKMLEMQGFPNLNSYYYAMLTSDLFVQYAMTFEGLVTAGEIESFYTENEQLSFEYTLAEATPDIVRILSQEIATKEIMKMAENAVLVKN